MRDVRDSELGELQRAARALLAQGLMTPHPSGERRWRLVRRWAEVLDARLEELAGYRVRVGRTSVRLVRRQEHVDTTPVFTTPSDKPFDRSRYALLVLALAALERSGEQLTLTDLARRIRVSAEQTPGLAFDPGQHTSRLALSHAVRQLESLGALRLTDGSLEDWERGEAEAEALYDIDRSLCRRLFAAPVRSSGGPEPCSTPIPGKEDGTSCGGGVASGWSASSSSARWSTSPT